MPEDDTLYSYTVSMLFVLPLAAAHANSFFRDFNLCREGKKNWAGRARRSLVRKDEGKKGYDFPTERKAKKWSPKGSITACSLLIYFSRQP